MIMGSQGGYKKQCGNPLAGDGMMAHCNLFGTRKYDTRVTRLQFESRHDSVEACA